MSQKEVTENFMAVTGTTESVARVILERNDWGLQTALDDFYNGLSKQANEKPNPHTYMKESGSSSSTSSAAARATKKTSSKFKSFQELINNEDEDDEQNFFAGGERGSGLEVENPNGGKSDANKLVRDLLKKAEKGEQRPGGDDEPSLSDHFNGIGYTLGDATVPSRQVGSSTSASAMSKKVTREITFWKDGFQVGEGPLYRYDNPENASYLSQLNSGQAPLSLLDVQYGQEVDVNVQRKLDEEFRPPKRKLGGFNGTGSRLGSVISTDLPATESCINDTAPETTEKTIVDSNLDSKIQIRLTDGRKIIRHVNSSDSVASLYDFVASETSRDRQFYLATSFPVETIEKTSKSIKDAGLCNSVVIQRWV